MNFSPMQATGLPDAHLDARGRLVGTWCPATRDENPADGLCWLRAGFGEAVEANAIQIAERIGPGCVRRVFAIDPIDVERIVFGKDPEEKDPTERAGVFVIPLPQPGTSIREVRIEIDSTLALPFGCARGLPARRFLRVDEEETRRLPRPIAEAQAPRRPDRGLRAEDGRPWSSHPSDEAPVPLLNS